MSFRALWYSCDDHEVISTRNVNLCCSAAWVSFCDTDLKIEHLAILRFRYSRVRWKCCRCTKRSVCPQRRPWIRPQRMSGSRPSCRNMRGAAIRPLPSLIIVTNGPNLPFVDGAANDSKEGFRPGKTARGNRAGVILSSVYDWHERKKRGDPGWS